MTYHINARGAHAGVYTPDTADDWKRSVMIGASVSEKIRKKKQWRN